MKLHKACSMGSHQVSANVNHRVSKFDMIRVNMCGMGVHNIYFNTKGKYDVIFVYLQWLDKSSTKQACYFFFKEKPLDNRCPFHVNACSM